MIDFEIIVGFLKYRSKEYSISGLRIFRKNI